MLARVTTPQTTAQPIRECISLHECLPHPPLTLPQSSCCWHEPVSGALSVQPSELVLDEELSLPAEAVVEPLGTLLGASPPLKVDS